jgi:hypothetical protein
MRTEQKSKTALIKEIREYRRDYKKLVSDWSEQIQKRVQAEQHAAELAAILEDRKRLSERQEKLIEKQAAFIEKQRKALDAATNTEPMATGRESRHAWNGRRPFNPRRH